MALEAVPGYSTALPLQMNFVAVVWLVHEIDKFLGLRSELLD